MKVIDKIKKYLPVILCVLCALSIALMITVIIKTNDKKSFVPPSFDPSAKVGFPKVGEELGFSAVEVENGFSFYICGELKTENKTVELSEKMKIPIYFTSPESNKVWLRMQVFGEGETLISETGIIRSGEYIAHIEIPKIEKQSSIKLKIIAYEPHTYISKGITGLNNVIKIEN